MRRSLAAAGSLIGLAVALVSPPGASGATTRNSFDVTGAVFECPTHTYTVTSGAINEVMHESVDANGTTHFTVTDTPDRVGLVDEDGSLYSLRGAIWFGGSNDQILTATHMFNIVGRGGVSDSIRLIERFRDGELISRDFGSCVLP
jgi:hypothetical protein